MPGDPVLLEPPRLRQHLPLERADRLVVGLDRAVERAAELRDVRAHRREPLVELPAEVADLRARPRRSSPAASRSARRAARPIRFVGEAGMTLFDSASSWSDGSTSSAASQDDSSWRNITTNSGVAGSCRQYAFWPSVWMWSRTCRAWSAMPARARLRRRPPPRAPAGSPRATPSSRSRSTSRPGSFTITSGRSTPPSSPGIVCCSSKSQYGQHPGHLDHAPQLDLAPLAAHLRVRRAGR